MSLAFTLSSSFASLKVNSICSQQMSQWTLLCHSVTEEALVGASLFLSWGGIESAGQALFWWGWTQAKASYKRNEWAAR